ncbi:MAG: ABC transporter substrate-binding protein [Desulfobacula sp.]|nr:ABC transporter substrate-binding protein [Desulfobacula sp.]
MKIWSFLFYTIFFFTAAGSSANENIRIAFIPGQTTDAFYISVYHGVKSACGVLGVDLIYDGSPEWNVEKQIIVLNRVIEQKPDVILISPTDAKRLIGPLKKAHKKGIKIITLDTYIDDGKYQDGHGSGDFPYTHISSDNVYGGRMAAKALAEAIGRHGKVYIVKGSPASTTERREYGFKTEMRRYRNIKILKTLVCNEDPKLAEKQFKKVYTEHPDLSGVFGADLFSAIGVSAGINAIDSKTDKIKLVTIDATQPIVQEIVSGRIDSAIAQHPVTIGYYGVICAYGLITGAGSPISINTGFTVINADNIDDPFIKKYIYLSE